MPKAAEKRRTSRKRRGPKATNKPGRRPLIYDETIVRRFLESILKGNWIATAAAVAGVNESTISKWRTRGEAALELEEAGVSVPEDEAVYVRFVRDFRAAEAAAEDRIVGNLSLQTENSPAAAVGMLKMRWPKRWRDAPSQVEVSGPNGGPIALSPVLAQLTDEELAAKAAQLEAELDDADDG